MLRNPIRDEREGYVLADVASAHDAGLSVEHILGGAATAALARPAPTGSADLPLSEGLVRKGLVLAPHEILMLQTAEHAGTVAGTLRNMAAQRHRRARRQRELRRMLIYPAFLVAFGAAVSILSAQVTGGSLWPPLAIVTALVGGVWLTVRYVIHATQREDGGKVPLVSAIALDYGELPYLHAMHGLYSAGVTIQEAHDLALRTSPVTGVRMRLFAAGQLLGGDIGYADALHRAAALHPETRQMLTAAELAGDLEATFARAIQRREECFERNSRTLVRVAIAAIMVLVYGYVGYVVLSFYANYYGGLLGR